MGARGPLGKSADDRQGHTDLVKAEVFDEALDVPIPPEGMHPAVVRQWEAFWVSDVTRVLAETDLPAVERLFLYRSEWWEVHDAYRALEDGQVIVLGSAKQLTFHPTADRLLKLEAVIDKLESQLGLTPMARARLGVTLAQNQLTWQQVAAGKPTGQQAITIPTDTKELGV